MDSSDLSIWGLVSACLCVSLSALWFAWRVYIQHRLLKRALVRRIRKARQFERQSDRARNHFLAAVSHDLRQPLQAAGMYAEALAICLAGTPNAAIVDRLIQAIDSTGALLSSLVEISTLELGKVEPDLVAINLADLTQRLYFQLQPQAEQKSLRFVLQVPEHMVISDDLLLERLIRNLVVNALAYTERGGVILGARLRPGQIGIQVADTGCGIPAHQVESIFEDFTRLAPPDKQGHLGLGLSVVRRMAKLLNHTIEVKSVEGRGSSFTVWMERVGPT